MSLRHKKGARLKEARKDAKLTQEQLAEFAQYASKYISPLENGRKNLSYNAARVFSKILNVRAEWLMCEDDLKTEHDERDHECRIRHAEDSDVAEIMRDWGYIVERNDDKFIIIQTFDSVLCKNFPGCEIENNIPLICSAETFKEFSEHFEFMQTALIYHFLKNCSIGTNEDKLFAEKKPKIEDTPIGQKIPQITETLQPGHLFE